MVHIKKEYFLPIYWSLLILTTYMGLGEVFLLLVTIPVGLYILKKHSYSMKWKTNNYAIYFVGYYIISSIFGVVLGNLDVKNFAELIIKYIFIPTTIYYLIPTRNAENINMLKLFKNIIFCSIIYGLIESLIKYNFIFNIISSDLTSLSLNTGNSRFYQPSSFFLHYNYYGCVLILGLIIDIFIPYSNIIINLIFKTLLVEQIFMCQSRISWIATCVILIVRILFYWKLTYTSIKLAMFCVLSTAFIIIFDTSIFTTISNFIVDRFSRLWIYGFADGSFGQRVGTLINWLTYFKNNIIEGCLGTGYHSASGKFLEQYSYFAGFSTVDCQLTVYLVETGILGVLILTLAIIKIFREKIEESTDAKIINYIARIGIIGYLCESLTLDIASNNIIIFLIMMMFVMTRNNNLKKRRNL